MDHRGSSREYVVGKSSVAWSRLVPVVCGRRQRERAETINVLFEILKTPVVAIWVIPWNAPHGRMERMEMCHLE